MKLKHQNWKISTCKRLDLESLSLGCWLTMPKKFRGTGADWPCNVSRIYVNSQLGQLKTIRGTCIDTHALLVVLPTDIREGSTTVKMTNHVPWAFLWCLRTNLVMLLTPGLWDWSWPKIISTVCKLNYSIKHKWSTGRDRKAWYSHPYWLRQQMKQE